MKKEEYFARGKPRKCKLCGKQCHNYQSEVAHLIWCKKKQKGLPFLISINDPMAKYFKILSKFGKHE